MALDGMPPVDLTFPLYFCSRKDIGGSGGFLFKKYWVSIRRTHAEGKKFSLFAFLIDPYF